MVKVPSPRASESSKQGRVGLGRPSDAIQETSNAIAKAQLRLLQLFARLVTSVLRNESPK